MEKKESGRRDFIKLSVTGLGGFAVTSIPGVTPERPTPETSAPGHPLHIVCVGAHPGDPEFGCGGTMAKYRDAGHAVTFLYLTRGEASNPEMSFAEMAALRTREAEAACKVLGATPKFVGQIDGDTVLDKEKSEMMVKFLSEEKPDIVFTQWPVDSHPDHQVTGLLVLTGWVKSKRRFDLYFYEVNTGSETMAFTPTDYVDITSVRERKKEAMFAHKTQDPVKTYNTYFKPLEEFRGLEAGVTAAEGFIHFKTTGANTKIRGL